MADMDDDQIADKIAAKLDAEEAAGANTQPQQTPEPQQTTAPKAADTAPEPPPAAASQGTTEPPPAAIDPPPTWKAELKDRWTKLPADLQRDLAQWETERNTGVTSRLEKAAAAERAAVAAKQQADALEASMVQERQRYSQTLAGMGTYLERMDPVIAEYRSTDLVNLARTDPARYTALDAQYRQRSQVIEATVRDYVTAQQSAQQTHLQREQEALLERVPEWRQNPQTGHETIGKLRNFAVTTYGYKPEEVQTIGDHRLVLMARDAAEAPQLRAELARLRGEMAQQQAAARQAITDKRVPPATQRVARPNPATEGPATGAERDKALINRASKAKSLSEKAEILAGLSDR